MSDYEWWSKRCTPYLQKELWQFEIDILNAKDRHTSTVTSDYQKCVNNRVRVKTNLPSCSKTPVLADLICQCTLGILCSGDWVKSIKWVYFQRHGHVIKKGNVIAPIDRPVVWTRSAEVHMTHLGKSCPRWGARFWIECEPEPVLVRRCLFWSTSVQVHRVI